jgi:hypothetical protein
MTLSAAHEMADVERLLAGLNAVAN